MRVPGGASRSLEGRLHWNYGPENPAERKQLRTASEGLGTDDHGRR